jgi:hypothetical protein
MKEIKKYLGVQQRLWLNGLLKLSTIPAHYKSVIMDVLTKDWYNSEEQYLLNLLREDYGKSS